MSRKPAFVLAFSAVLLAAGPLLFLGWIAGILTLEARALRTPIYLEEAGSMQESTSRTWWVNSGAAFYPSATGGRTVRGELPEKSRWRMAYAAANPMDTDNGYHPQNIFRLITVGKRQEVSQQAYFTINQYHASESPNRNESNGLLFFSRYLDGDNLYYAGVRVDGHAVIKKKKNGVYYTLAYKRIISDGTYDRSQNPNLLKTGIPIGLRSEVRTLANGRVSIRLFTDMGKTGTWTRVADVIDDGVSYGGAAIVGSGSGGIRTDFMDVVFEGYEMKGL